MSRAYLFLAVALLAGIPLHGREHLLVFDVVGGARPAPRGLAQPGSDLVSRVGPVSAVSVLHAADRSAPASAPAVTAGEVSNTRPLDAAAPQITTVQNNYSWVSPGAINYGIAPGSIFAIVGSGMATPGVPAVLQDSSEPQGLPATLNGASVAVTVAGVTVHPVLYYATATQIAAVLPSTTPLGQGTVTVTYSGVPSAPAAIDVVQSAPGLASIRGDGAGAALATDANYHFLTPTASGASGQIVTLWGSGLGADNLTSDTNYASPHQITNIPFAAYLGGLPAKVVWAGRSGYPGLDQINLQLPVPDYTSFNPVPSGCAVPLTLVGGAASIGSNTVALPITMAGGACMHPSSVIDSGAAETLGGNATVHVGYMSVSQDGAQVFAGGSFSGMPGAALTAYAGTGPTAGGNCIAVPPEDAYAVTGLYAGSVVNASAAALGGSQALLYDGAGDYGGPMPSSWVPAPGDTFTFAGLGGFQVDIGVFNAAVQFPETLEWTNQDSLGVISREQGVRLTWTGGDADGVVAIRGTSFAAAGAPIAQGSFLCSAPARLGQFTVPPSVLQTLPAGAGTLTLENQSAPQTMSAAGLDAGYVFAGARLTANAAFH